MAGVRRHLPREGPAVLQLHEAAARLYGALAKLYYQACGQGSPLACDCVCHVAAPPSHSYMTGAGGALRVPLDYEALAALQELLRQSSATPGPRAHDPLPAPATAAVASGTAAGAAVEAAAGATGPGESGASAPEPVAPPRPGAGSPPSADPLSSALSPACAYSLAPGTQPDDGKERRGGEVLGAGKESVAAEETAAGAGWPPSSGVAGCPAAAEEPPARLPAGPATGATCRERCPSLPCGMDPYQQLRAWLHYDPAAEPGLRPSLDRSTPSVSDSPSSSSADPSCHPPVCTAACSHRTSLNLATPGAVHRDTSPSDPTPCADLGLCRSPLSIGPCGLSHPGYRHGFLRRPFGLQLAWAAAVWRVTGCFPYPEAATGRPPLLREGPAWEEAVGQLPELLEQLLVPEGPPLIHTSKPAGEGGTGNDGGGARAGDGAGGTRGSGGGDGEGEGDAAAAAPALGGDGLHTWRVDESVLIRLLHQPQLLYVLLGFRLTAGSATRLVPLPDEGQCWAAFEERHSPATSSVLTVGARALTKHTHRDTRGEWWPRMSGSEAAKNQLAAGALRGLLGGAVWVNLHQLPPFDSPKYVLELRTLQGYGARWAVEGVTEPGAAAPVDGRGFEGGVGSREAHGGESEGTGVAARLPAGEGGSGQPRFRFRGFLEPTMEGGHEVGWRH